MPESRTLYLAGAAIIVVVLAVAAYFYLISPAYEEEPAEEAPAPREEAPQEEAQPEILEGEAEVRVILSEWSIEPSEIRVKPGTTVTFVIVNEGRFTHALTVERLDIGFSSSSESLGAGGETTLTVTFEEPGEYVIYCPIGDHRQRGMEGIVVVVEP